MAHSLLFSTCVPAFSDPQLFLSHHLSIFHIFFKSYLHIFSLLFSLFFYCHFSGVWEGSKQMRIFSLPYFTESPFSTFLASCALNLLCVLLSRIVYNICNALPMPFLGLEYLQHLVCLENSPCSSSSSLLGITDSLFCVPTACAHPLEHGFQTGGHEISGSWNHFSEP